MTGGLHKGEGEGEGKREGAQEAGEVAWHRSCQRLEPGGSSVSRSQRVPEAEREVEAVRRRGARLEQKTSQQRHSGGATKHVCRDQPVTESEASRREETREGNGPRILEVCVAMAAPLDWAQG